MHFQDQIKNVLEEFLADESRMNNSRNCIEWNIQCDGLTFENKIRKLGPKIENVSRFEAHINKTNHLSYLHILYGNLFEQEKYFHWNRFHTD